MPVELEAVFTRALLLVSRDKDPLPALRQYRGGQQAGKAAIRDDNILIVRGHLPSPPPTIRPPRGHGPL